jgi:ribosomal protein S21
MLGLQSRLDGSDLSAKHSRHKAHPAQAPRRPAEGAWAMTFRPPQDAPRVVVEEGQLDKALGVLRRRSVLVLANYRAHLRFVDRSTARRKKAARALRRRQKEARLRKG